MEILDSFVSQHRVFSVEGRYISRSSKPWNIGKRHNRTRAIYVSPVIQAVSVLWSSSAGLVSFSSELLVMIATQVTGADLNGHIILKS